MLPLLSLVTMQTQINAEINVAYIVAITAWQTGCTFFSFMALFELACAIIYAHHLDDRKQKVNRNSVHHSKHTN